jgi:hypothetical protein
MIRDFRPLFIFSSNNFPWVPDTQGNIRIWLRIREDIRKKVGCTPLCKYDIALTLDLIFEWLWLPLKAISIEKTLIGKLVCTIPITFTQKIWGLTRDRFCHSGVNDTSVTKIGDFLPEFEAIFKKALTRVSGV